ncbi:MAG: hypothetical protein QF615_09755 [Planctomycetota bacterium]|jgi:hypothetical protein|nr:hypothetical protein [Planctomycetota bacterium]MDP6369884.1 hypothetical protein [Planctomycetota bacterium]MDP6520614.1 hypothetical protein [Planctomycetota bacterium]
MNDRLDLERRLIEAKLSELVPRGERPPAMPGAGTAQGELSYLHGKELGLLAAEAERVLSAAAELGPSARAELDLRARVWLVAWNAERGEYAGAEPRVLARLEELRRGLEYLLQGEDGGSHASSC